MGNCYYSIWYEFDSNREHPTLLVNDAPSVEDIMTAFGFDSLSEFHKFDAAYNVLRRAGKTDNEAMSALLPSILN